jgi:4-carboxymuconolactone decarboxylase
MLRFAAPALACAALGLAQAPPTRELNLVGGRFAPLKWEEMTPAQKTMVEHLLSGPRGGLGGPFNVLLRSPEMGDQAQEFGASMRFLDSIPAKLRELTIILTARHWTSHYEWQAHRRAAAQAGLAEPIIQSIAAGRRPQNMDAEETIVYNFVTELLQNKQVSDATFAAIKERFGEKTIVDLIGLMGWYQMVSMLLNVDQYPLGPGQSPELKPLP